MAHYENTLTISGCQRYAFNKDNILKTKGLPDKVAKCPLDNPPCVAYYGTASQSNQAIETSFLLSTQ